MNILNKLTQPQKYVLSLVYRELDNSSDNYPQAVKGLIERDLVELVGTVDLGIILSLTPMGELVADCLNKTAWYNKNVYTKTTQHLRKSLRA